MNFRRQRPDLVKPASIRPDTPFDDALANILMHHLIKSIEIISLPLQPGRLVVVCLEMLQHRLLDLGNPRVALGVSDPQIIR